MLLFTHYTFNENGSVARLAGVDQSVAIKKNVFAPPRPAICERKRNEKRMGKRMEAEKFHKHNIFK